MQCGACARLGTNDVEYRSHSPDCDYGKYNRNLPMRAMAQAYIAGLHAAGVKHEFEITELKDKYAPGGAWYCVEQK